MIRISPISVIGPDNENVGLIETRDALQMARDAGLDLVEIRPDDRPPLCKIMDYGKYKYELSKREKKGSGSKASELKQLRLGRSVKIDEHDVQIRVDQARRFLLQGHKVQFEQRFRGREMAHQHLGLDRLKRIADALSDIAKVETMPRFAGRAASFILAPDKHKVEQYKRLMKAAGKEELPPEQNIPDDIDDHDDDLDLDIDESGDTGVEMNAGVDGGAGEEPSSSSKNG